MTLTGRVLPVGGVKEKVLAAKRAGVRRVALPAGNKKDWDELEAEVREGLDAAFFEEYGSLFEEASVRLAGSHLTPAEQESISQAIGWVRQSVRSA